MLSYLPQSCPIPEVPFLNGMGLKLGNDISIVFKGFGEVDYGKPLLIFQRII